MPSGTQRDQRLDSIRGFLLVAMTLNHFAGGWRKYTFESLGYVSWAEGFVVLSAYVYALVYFGYLDTGLAVIRKSLQRALTIYGYHVLVATLVLFVIPRLIVLIQDPSDLSLASLRAYSGVELLYCLLFLIQPIYLDVLPLYVFFLLIAPYALILIHQRKMLLVLVLSTIFWIIGQQIDPMQAVAKSFGIVSRSGYFNPLIWQSLWILGLCMGYGNCLLQSKSIDWERLKRWRQVSFFLLTAGAVVFFLFRHGVFEYPQELKYLVDRKSLGLLRLLNLICVTGFTGLVFQYIPQRCGLPGLTFLGQHSLQVFSFHLLIVYLVGPYGQPMLSGLGLIDSGLIMLGAVLLLFVPAALHQRWQRRGLR